MAKIPLPIDKDYCSGWGVYHGLRELIQNAKDAEEFEGRRMEINHYPRTNRLEIITHGVYVAPASLLVLGKTSKSDGRQRGKFGEGFVLGILALMRRGCEVKFRNGDQSWTVSFESPDVGHPLEGNELLTFKSRELASREVNFQVEIEGISIEAWNIVKSKFLFLDEPKEADKLETPDGTLLLHPDKKGEIYVRGIYVRKFDDLACGYDLHGVQLDRDRQMIDEWQLHYALGKLWTTASGLSPELAAPRVYDMAKSDNADARQLKYHADDKLLASVRERFENEHGKEAVPVSTNAEAHDVQGSGGKPTMVSGVLKDLLEKGGLSVEASKKQLESVVERRWAPAELQCGDEADDVAYAAMCRLEEIFPSLVVVTFRGDKLGCHLLDENTVIGVDRRLLSTPFRDVLYLVAVTEARRLGIRPVDVLINHVVTMSAPELQSPSALQEPFPA